MALWTFRYFVESNKSDVKDAYDDAGKQTKAKFLSRLRILSNIERSEWNETLFKSLSGPCDGLQEIRFLADNVQQRPLGFISGLNEFTILFWATEKGGKFVPKSACKIASGRKARVLAKEKVTDALWLALE